MAGYILPGFMDRRVRAGSTVVMGPGFRQDDTEYNPIGTN
jgi:hypothetical protein